jgi:hypothetical protein
MATNFERMRWLIDSVFDATDSVGLVTISASSEAAGLPVANVQSPFIRKVYRSTDTNREFIRWDLGSPQQVRQIFIGNHNFSKTAGIQIKGHTSSNFSSPSFTESLSVVTDSLGITLNKINTFFSTVQTYRHWRLDIVDPGNASSGLQVGRVMAGSPINPRRNLSDGFTRRQVDPSRGVQTAGRQGYFKKRDRYEELTFSMPRMERSDWDEIQGIYNKVGLHSPFVVALQPDTRPIHDTFYVQFAQPLNMDHQVLDSVNITRVTLSEKT